MDHPQPRELNLLQRSSTLLRRFSRRAPTPTPQCPGTARPNKLQRRATQHRTERTEKTEKPSLPMITHLQCIELPEPHSRPSRPVFSSCPPSNPSTPGLRVQPTDMQTQPFPLSPQIHTEPWNVSLSPQAVYRLVMGFHPREMQDRWFIYAEGPDRSGKLKVHFHRSWSGLKIAELFILVDLQGDTSGRIVGVKWNGSEETNGMSENEAKYMVSTTCAWVLGVDLDRSVL